MILTYHEITPRRSAYVYSATASELEEHIQLIGSVVHPLRSPAVTFDDGHVSQFTHALPVLERGRQKATFFVTAGWTGSRSDYMTWPQLRELAALGHGVQAHGWTHALLTHCTPDQLAEELRRSKQILEDGLGSPVNAISMPGGRWNDSVLAACAREGYRYVYTSDPYAGMKKAGGVMVAGRAMIRCRTTAPELLRLLHSEHGIWSREKIQFRLKRSVRAVLGDHAYHRLWSWVGNSSQRLNATEGVAGDAE